MYKLLLSLLSPEKAGDKPFKSLTEVITKHYNPVPSEIVQRYKFHTRFRQPGETVSTYVSELRSLAVHCNFGATLDLMLRDRLVCGINDDAIQRRLLSEQNLTFDKALTTAQGLEAAAKNLRESSTMTRSRLGETAKFTKLHEMVDQEKRSVKGRQCKAEPIWCVTDAASQVTPL